MIRPKSSHDYHKPAEREEEKIDGELAKVIASDLQTFKTVEGMDQSNTARLSKLFHQKNHGKKSI